MKTRDSWADAGSGGSPEWMCIVNMGATTLRTLCISLMGMAKPYLIGKTFFLGIWVQTSDQCVQNLATAASSSCRFTVWDCSSTERLPTEASQLPSRSDAHNKYSEVLGCNMTPAFLYKCLLVCSFFIPSKPGFKVRVPRFNALKWARPRMGRHCSGMVLLGYRAGLGMGRPWDRQDLSYVGPGMGKTIFRGVLGVVFVKETIWQQGIE